MGIVPPIDVIGMGASPGDQPTNTPSPTNMQINDALQDAISDINRECQFHVLQFTIPVAAFPSTLFGPFTLDLSTLQPNTAAFTVNPVALINDVLRVLWLPTTGPAVLVTPSDRNALDRGRVSDYFAQSPGVPERWYVEQYRLYLTPSPSIDGSIVLTCGTGIVGLQCEDDVLDEVPIDFQNIFEDRAIVRIAMSNPQDVEGASLMQAYGPSSEAGMRQFKTWKEGHSGVPQAVLAFSSYRRGYGTRRTRR